MQLHQLEYFVAVAETLSFTRGAQRVHTAQSAVSAAIGHLEGELGVRLFDRGPRGITLTDHGTALLPKAREALAAVAAVADAAAQRRGEISGVVTVGTMEHTGPFDIVGTLERLQRDHPGVIVRLRQTSAGSTSSLAELRSGSLDVALIAGMPRSTADVEIESAHEDPLDFVCAADHPLAGHQSVEARDLTDQNFIEYPLGWGNRAVADAWFEASFTPRVIRTEVTHFDLAVDLVARSLGVTLLPRQAVPDDPRIRRIPIAGGPLWTVGIARSTHRPVSIATRTLIEYLRTQAAE
ncbi:LysR family transcriptional regulator [Gryllotalpicola reticulitermitis]|uniref:LysR family transcriptional regulator n=1 Tax=Gryllotalpicola reticulitermitis TaxID=1184153 RepID=A0ABV8PZX0_9MICO